MSTNVPRHLSPTSIDRWRQCPRRFLFQDIERREFDEVKTYEQTLGEVVHKTLERLFRMQPRQRTDEALARHLDWSLMRFSSAPALSGEGRERLRGEAQEMLLKFGLAGATSVDAIKVEQSFQLRLSNGTVIQTRVDRIDRAENGLLRVVDYKTGRTQIDESDLGRELAPIVQLLAVGKASEIPVEKVAWIYLRSGESINWWPEAEDVDYAVECLIKVLRKLHEDRDFPPNPGVHCQGCPFRFACPAWPEAEGPAGELEQAA